MPTSPSNQLPTTVPPPTPPQRRRTRSERVALRSASQGIIGRLADNVRKDHLGLLFLIMCLTTLAVCLVLRAWDPPFEFHANDPVDRAIVCNTAFSVESPEARRTAEERARWYSPHVYANDPKQLTQLQESLWITIGTLLAAGSYDKLDDNGKETWHQFLRPRGTGAIPEDLDPQTALATFLSHFRGEKRPKT